MLSIVVVLVLVGLLAVAVWRGGIPTPVPRHLISILSRARGSTVGLTIYRLILLTVLVVGGVTLLIINPSGLIAFVIFGLGAFFLMDHLRQVARDVWDANFWEWSP